MSSRFQAGAVVRTSGADTVASDEEQGPGSVAYRTGFVNALTNSSSCSVVQH